MTKAKKSASKKAAKKTVKKAPPKRVVKKAVPKKVAKKAPPKKAAKKQVKKTPPKKSVKKTIPKKAAAPHVASFEALDLAGTGTLQFNVKFFGGAGQIVFKGQNLDKTVTSDSMFTVSQDKGSQTVFVGGAAPAGASGRIEVQVGENGAVLSPFSANTFTGLFNSAITYTVV
jgi:hypothetical protein